MQRAPHQGRRLVALVVAGLALAACGSNSADRVDDEAKPATVEPIAGSNLDRVTLTADAARRLDIKTEAVRADGTGTTIPYSAILYDPEGDTYAFVNAKELTFERRPIVVGRIENGLAFLTSGPAAGTKVVTVGGPELYGAELGVGDDE